MALLLYHGTTTKYLPDIVLKGLKPRSETGVKTNWPVIPSKVDMVYLTSAYGLKYAVNATDWENQKGETREYPVVLRVRLEPWEIFPDEDFIAYAQRMGGAKISLQKMANAADVTQYDAKTALNSLQYLGTCCTTGVDRSQIIGWVIVKNEFLINEGRATDCNVPNFQILGKHLTLLHMKYLFGKGEYPVPESTKVALNSSALDDSARARFLHIISQLSGREGIERYDKKGRRVQ